MAKKESNKQVPSTDGRFLLNLGCGSRLHKDWNNIDSKPYNPSVLSFDLLKGIPYGNNIFDAVYCAHFLEHLDRQEVNYLLNECYRVMKPNGIIRIVVPDLEYNTKLYLECLGKVLQDDNDLNREHYEWALLNLIDQIVRRRSGGEIMRFLGKEELLDEEFIVRTTGGVDVKFIRQQALSFKMDIQKGLRGFLRKTIIKFLPFMDWIFLTSGENHKWMYDRYSLIKLLEMRFCKVHLLAADESQINGFSLFNLDINSSGEIYKPNSLFVEAFKV